ncbi:MAG: adenylate/guanylate cyclase domain-containing protein [Solirubrobacterales bacterium]
MTAPLERRSRQATTDAGALAAELDLSADEHQLVAGLLRLGVTAEQIRGARQHGRLEEAIFEGVLDPERERRTVSPAEIEADGGLAASEITATLRAFGLPPPGPEEHYFTPEEARVFRELGRLEDVWPPDMRLEISRVYGQALGRIAQTELHLFRARVEPLLRDMTDSPLDTLGAVRQAFGWLLPLADPLLLGVHRRKLEQEMTQAAVWAVESEAEGLVPGTVEVSLLFLDLRHFTSYANRHGDATAIEAIDRLGRAVTENKGDAGRVVKQLGDGYMLVYPDPDAATASALAIAGALEGSEGPPLHGGLHHGRTVFRDGDYFGRAVNLAARLLSIAKDDELLATAGVADSAPLHPWKTRGEHTLLGFQAPIEVFALRLADGTT